jgi:hypothetical protein
MVVTHDRQERQPITAPTRNWRSVHRKCCTCGVVKIATHLIAASVGEDHLI